MRESCTSLVEKPMARIDEIVMLAGTAASQAGSIIAYVDAVPGADRSPKVVLESYDCTTIVKGEPRTVLTAKTLRILCCSSVEPSAKETLSELASAR